MTPTRLPALVAKALNRKPTLLELETWRDVLTCPPRAECDPTGCVHDNEAEQALRQHVASSTFPPTAADVRKIAISLANARIEANEFAERERALELRVPPTPEYLAARAEWDRWQAERAQQLDAARDNQPSQSVREAARAAIDAELATHEPEEAQA